MIRKFFNIMSVRERFLAAAFIWVIAIVWLSGQSKGWRAFFAEKQSVKSQLQQNDTWFEVEEMTELGLQEELKRFDPAKTYSDDKLAAFIDLQARDSSLDYDFTSNRTQPKGIFNIHSRRIKVKDATIEELIAFDERLKSAYPYIGLEQAQFVGNRSDYRKIDAEFIISSFELTTQTLSAAKDAASDG